MNAAQFRAICDEARADGGSGTLMLAFNRHFGVVVLSTVGFCILNVRPANDR